MEELDNVSMGDGAPWYGWACGDGDSSGLTIIRLGGELFKSGWWVGNVTINFGVAVADKYC